jgi:Uncharacterized protein conserved in bacteria (DUF2252)
MNIVEATRRYEAWLIASTIINQRHLLRKHELMREGVVTFLRATFYRWIQIWPEICPDLVRAPTVLSVGDLHIENFGTWRDVEGRLIWGINDFDEAYPLPYTNDLVRLAASAMLAKSKHLLVVKPKDACEAILSGYMTGLETGGRPFVLEEDHKNLRALAFSDFRNPRRFWKKLLDQDKVRGGIPKNISKMFDEVMPKTEMPYQFLSPVSGLGTLGRFRVVAITESHGGKFAREVEALAPSACLWARNRESKRILYQSIIGRAVRSHDPFIQVKEESWLIRRLSPHCCRIEMNELPKKRDEYRLLEAMGWETANIHLGSRASAGIRRDLAKRHGNWLREAAKAMVKATASDWKDWKNS